MLAINTPLPAGYRRGMIDGQNVYAHRIIWKMVHGRDPAGEIDHINGDKGDNRIENLREVSHAENQRNMSVKCKHGAPGIVERNGRWGATIGGIGHRKWLGTFASKEEAVSARKDAEALHNYHANHGRVK